MARRSVLFTPGDRPEMLGRATETGADVAVFDLEDGVAPDRKPAAREHVRDAVAALETDTAAASETDAEVCVRVNPVGRGAREDLDAVLQGACPDGLVLPKVGAPGDVRALADLAADRGADLPIFALVESAAGVLRAGEIGAADPTDCLLFGAQDLAGDLGGSGIGAADLPYPRQRVLVAARAAGVDAVDTHYPDVDDLAGLRAEAADALSLGYDGKMALHPDQVTVLNEAFTPEAARIEWARRVLEATDGAAVAVVDGEMVDAPQRRQAERILERAGVDP
ncbi:MAG: CoA ester lyase [Haloarculaceae archaeon]